MIWNILSYAFIAVITFTALRNVDVDWPDRFLPSSEFGVPWRTACFIGSLLWVAWYTVFIVRFDLWIGRERWKAISFFFAILLAFGLSFIYPAYLFLLFGLFGVAFGVLPLRWSISVVVTLSLAIILRVLTGRTLDQSALGFISWMGMYLFIAIMMGVYIASIIRSNHERQAVIDQLRAAQKELALRERQSGILEERQRLAAAIHDTLAQNLASIVMHLEAAEQALPPGEHPGGPARHLASARDAARQGLGEARRIVWALQPAVVEREPLDHALRRVAERWASETAAAVSFIVEGQTRDLTPPAEVTLLRAVQEGLANVRKHAAASRVNLTLTYMEDEVLLDLQDDGRGLDPNQVFHPREDGSGYGLYSLRERVLALGGSLSLESEPGQGATLVIQLPCEPSEKKEVLP
jgi:signal transduction histidine kinase